jgi:hypothetical protein
MNPIRLHRMRGLQRALPQGRRLAAGLLAAAAGCAHAQFSGPPAYQTLPWSQIGPGASTLVVTTNAGGFTVTGQYSVTAPATAATGILAAWTLDRPIAAGVSNPAFVTTTLLDGFVAPPIGAFAPTSGIVTTYVTDTAVPGTVVPGSQSSIAISLVAGATTWPTLSASSGPFPLVTGTSTTYVLRQAFWLDGNQLGGPGGAWVVDVPVVSTLAPVPEPASLLLMAAGLLALLRRLHRKG